MATRAVSAEEGDNANAPVALKIAETSLPPPHRALLAMAVPLELNSVSTGRASAPVTPNAASEGPIPRTSIVAVPGPESAKPPVSTLAPDPELARAERLTRRPSG